VSYFGQPFGDAIGGLDWIIIAKKGDNERNTESGGDVLKEHGVSLLFEEWKQVEEGQPLHRVWIRIFRLLQKLS
jgi:hypothetical protein